MAASVAMPNSGEPRLGTTITGAGLSPSTRYQVKVTDPSGFQRMIEVTTDGAGAFSLPHVPQQVGTSTVEVRPVAEVQGTTTPIASVTQRTKI